MDIIIRNSEEQEVQPGREHQMQEKPLVIRETYKGSGKLQGKTALITGGDSGIGKSAAIHFAREGAQIAIVYLEEDTDAKETKKEIEAEGGDCLLIEGDIKDPEFAKKAVADTIAHFKGLNILVNNAAVQYPEEDLQGIDLKKMEKTFQTNIFSYFYFAQAALPHLQDGDAIINTTSVTAYRGSEHLIDYASTKGAIVSFTRSLAASLADKNIRVNGIAPGPIWTPLIPATFQGKELENFGRDVPMKRPGQPAEVGPAYVFLASADSSYMTGQIIHINGGEIVGS